MDLSSAITAGFADAQADLTTNVGALAAALIPLGLLISGVFLVIRKARVRG